jgi:hypothetical protein
MVFGSPSLVLFSFAPFPFIKDSTNMQRLIWTAAILTFCSAAHAQDRSYDVVIYGGTSGGIAAAVQTARMGHSVVLIEPGKHLGGLTSGGLGATDIGNKAAIGGISREFYRRVGQHYAKPEAWRQETREKYQSSRQRGGEEEMWTFEPHVAEQIFRDMLAEAKVPVVFQSRLDLKDGVVKQGGRITAIRMEDGRTLAGKMFIDATYEGDLMAKAGVSYHVGREANSVYGETLNGVQPGRKFHQFQVAVDPYIVPSDPKSGLLPGIHGGDPGKPGEGDHRVQAYNFRMCLTDVKENQVPFPKPAGYYPLRYELCLRTILAGQWDGLGAPAMMPNRKTDTNNKGAFSSDNIGMNYDYPDGDYATRERIFEEHVTYQQGWCWFLANDPRVPQKIRSEVSRWGLAKDEFTDHGNWPHQLYVREARRMIGDYVMTQHNCQGREIAPDPIGLAAYTMDSHNVQRYVQDGKAINEGDVQVGGFAPYPVAYRSIIPKASQCTNLLVPVCLSATHIAYGSIRMEPVFMVLGQSAATAACHAIDERADVQNIEMSKLRERLLADKQVLEWTGARPAAGLSSKSLKGLVLDDTKAQVQGEWSSGRTVGPFVDDGYLHDGDVDKGKKSVRFAPPIEKAGQYEVRLAYSAHSNRATNVPVTIESAEGRTVARVNQRQSPPIDKTWQSLGTFRFEPGKPAAVTIANEGTDGHVIADAVQFLSVP